MFSECAVEQSQEGAAVVGGIENGIVFPALLRVEQAYPDRECAGHE